MCSGLPPSDAVKPPAEGKKLLPNNSLPGGGIIDVLFHVQPVAFLHMWNSGLST
jgi:hypothetical protein